MKMDDFPEDENADSPLKRGAVKNSAFTPLLDKEGARGWSQVRWTNPLESPLTNGDTRDGAAKSIFSQLPGAAGRPTFDENSEPRL